MDFEIYELPEAAKHYPTPKVPMLPAFSFSDLSFLADNSRHSRFLQPDAVFVPSGRMALYYVLQLLDISQEDEVLLPAYHCGSMLEPVLYVGASPVFYSLTSDLQIDIGELRRRITKETKALLVPHFFGFAQDLDRLRAFCDQNSIALIEDCAHSFYGTAGEQLLGSVGDYSIASTVKFFPGVEGGVLVSNKEEIPAQQIFSRSQGPYQQLKSCINTLEMAANYSRLGILGRLLKHRSKPDDSSEKVRSEYSATTEKKRHLTRDVFQWFMPEQIGVRASYTTKAITTYWNSRTNISKRRKNYQYIVSELCNIEGIKPLFENLSDTTVPYVIPVLIDNPELTFPKLKHKGIPIWRWEELVDTDCNISRDYRLKLIQLPCHQTLSNYEIEWIIGSIKKILI
ncbi:MAG: DegT/DnrJ/EryC1/StrS family aminotransferase [Motiliproteus sp.]|nr:DegT/DnrJ/EryC1/StrS family aminotransferase [Motiliproteus sp.]MCW9052380.1 DegT/DnrJ/EryC1/StrS family aminotransferase [Motiliproteus sp.]